MTTEEKSTIRRLRFDGQGYAQIARALDMPEGTIKTFCRRNDLLKANIGATKHINTSACKQCCKPLDYVPKRKPKQFCSDGCRLSWWNANRDRVSNKGAIERACITCGKMFFSYDEARKYCSRNCYFADRFRKVRMEHDERAV